MQTAAYRPPPMASAFSMSATEPVRTSVAHLLTRTDGIPCMAAAQAFTQLVQPASRFTVSLDLLLPILSGNSEEASVLDHANLRRRIVVAYILYSLYAAYPIAINPFRSAFVEVFNRERDISIRANEGDSIGGVSCENEQLVWVLWKILKGDGNDLGPYTPAQLLNSTLPPKLRAAQLSIDESVGAEDESFREQPANGRLLTPISTDGASANLLALRTPDSAISVSPANDGRAAEYVEKGKQLLIAATQRVLNLPEQRAVVYMLPHVSPQNVLALHTIPFLIALNPALGHPLVVQYLSNISGSELSTPFTRSDVLEILRKLPPTLPSFDVMGRLLRDPSTIRTLDADQYYASGLMVDRGPAEHGFRKTTIADLVRTEVLGAFVLNSIGWVERTEQEALAGLVSDDRAAKGVQNLCRFYNSLIKLNLVDISSDADSVEMGHFALAHAQYEDANALYRVLAMGKF